MPLRISPPSSSTTGWWIEAVESFFRGLQHLFNQYVGVGPKWAIRRYRIFEALEQLHAEGSIDTGRLALDLGYTDQAYFIKDFKGLTGTIPAQYNRKNRIEP